jgi:endonuclease YncB( thermonuclease family)
MEKKDKYGRIIGKVFTTQEKCEESHCLSNVDAGLLQIQSGLAWHYKKYEKEQAAVDRNLYANAESLARLKTIGIWREINPVAPWDYRRK